MKNSKLITIIRQEKFNKQIKPIIFFVNQATSKPCYICALSFDGHVEASLDYYHYKRQDQRQLIAHYQLHFPARANRRVRARAGAAAQD